MSNEKGLVHETCKWCYRGVWGVLTQYFCLPDGPPNLPVLEGEEVQYLRPSVEYLEYQKFLFWIGLFAIDIVLSSLWIALSMYSVWWAIFTAPLWIVIIVAPDVVAYISIHLRYDTTWYVLTDRSMRIRRGIWNIYETTITFENIQNVHINQGPIQRWFGFANLMVMTAGGGGGAEGVANGCHLGLLEGLNNAAELRERILAKSQKGSGLGDERTQEEDGDAIVALRSLPSSSGLAGDQLELLRDIHNLTAQWVRNG